MFFQFSYPLHIFVVYIVFGFVFASENIFFGYIFYKLARHYETVELRLLFYSFTILGVSVFLEALGYIYFAIYGSAETPITFGSFKINFLPLTVAINIAAIFLWYVTLFVYARLKRNDILFVRDYIVVILGILGIIFSLLPQNMWMQGIPRLQIPSAYNPNPEIHIESIVRLITGLLIIFVGFFTVLAYYALYMKKRRETEDIVVLKRHEMLLVAILLLVFAVSSLVFRDISFLSGAGGEMLPTPIMTLVLVVIMEILSAFLLYLGIVAPDWIVERWSKHE